MKRFAIGDIHGGYLALKQVLDRINYDPAEHILFFVGDYVDGWPESKQVIDLLVKIKEENPSCVFIRGNHDQWMVDFILSSAAIAPNYWVNQGGKATLESYGAQIFQHMSDCQVVVNIPEDHIEFFNETVLYHITEDNKGFVHGGYVDPRGLGYDEPEVYLWDRDTAYYIASGASTDLNFIKAHDELYIGHTTTLMWGKVLPVSREGKYFNIDTGGGWGGKLTAIDIDSKEVFQSDFVKDLYPGVVGR